MTQHLSAFLIQLIIIIITSRVFGYFFKKMGQPTVMGEILAGIFLGPSILGSLFPAYLQAIFPPGSLDTMRILSQIGLILFMFVVGMELDLDVLRTKARTAVTISNASIIIPFSLGVCLAYFLHDSYAPKDVPFYAFALFMGIAMSITAFPVLARIIRERTLRDKRIEAIAMTSAALNDVTGWVALAFVIAIIKAHSFSNSVYTLLATVAYMVGMVFIVRPLMNKLAKSQENNFVKQSTIAIIFIVMLLSSLCTELIGVHALFGAFMAGVIMPQQWHFRQIVTDKVEDVALILLLPLFFVITGLRTHINTVNTPTLWAVTLLIILVAVLGKLGGSAVAAKLTGENNYNSLSIGVLMNTRGLMELVILNIGYDLDILSQEIFTMMVIMALVTTFMTSPLLNLLDKAYNKKA
ncbi:MAG TPA: cation:proton antiporter [Flavipsychrobacter sp.]|nr:cation:proton antiporter [Flavipsychrobacter sp.]